MVPKGSGWTRRNELALIAGGPLMTALLFVPVALLPWSPSTVCFALANGLIAMGSWPPVTIGGHDTDARMFIQFSKTPQEHLDAIAQLWHLDYEGVSPHDWPPHLVSRLANAVNDAACGSLARRYRYLHARECGESPAIAGALEAVLACAWRLPPESQRSYFSEAAFLHARAGRVELARQWLKDARKVTGALPEPGWEAHVLSVIAIGEGRVEEAQAHIEIALAVLDDQPRRSGTIAASRARLLALRT